jgi:hypothetical protein
MGARGSSVELHSDGALWRPRAWARARGAERGEAEEVMCSIEMAKEHSSSGEELHRSAIVAVVA